MNGPLRVLPLGMIIFVASPAWSQETPLAFHGVVPGQTTEQELLKNATWMKPLSSNDQPDGSKLLEFKIDGWPKVTVLTRAGLVRLIDIVPPERAPADKLAEIWDLGRLSLVADRKGLPSTAWRGPAIEESLPLFQPASGSCVLLFAEKDDAKKYVKLIRFFPPSRLTGWLNVKSEDFSVMMPGKPRAMVQETLSEVGKVKSTRYTVAANGANFMITRMDYPAGAFANTDAGLNHFRAGISKSKGKLLKEEKISIQGHVGRELAWEDQAGDWVTTSQVVFVKDQLWAVSISSPKGKALPMETEEFFDSFQLAK